MTQNAKSSEQEIIRLREELMEKDRLIEEILREKEKLLRENAESKLAGSLNVSPLRASGKSDCKLSDTQPFLFDLRSLTYYSSQRK